MRLKDWLRNNWLVEHEPSRQEIADLLTVVDRDLEDCQSPGLSPDWRLAIAYNGALQIATAALAASGDTDPNEAFRYWWLFFRSKAFGPADTEKTGCWLDTIAQGSRDYAKELGQRLKNRVFIDIFPYLARGFLEDRKRRLGISQRPSEEQLHDTYEAALTLLYRLLFLLFAEARDLDQKTLSLVFIDYKSLEVRHLGSIYEGLLEFKLKIADEDLTTKTEKKKEKYIPLGKVKPKRGKTPEVVVRKGEVYLSNDKAERKASGSYYTPDPIVEYIVEHTVGPVLAEKLEKLRPRLRKVRKAFDNEVKKAQAYGSSQKTCNIHMACDPGKHVFLCFPCCRFIRTSHIR